MIKSVSGGNAITKNLIQSKKTCLTLSAVVSIVIDLALTVVFAACGLIDLSQIIMAFPVLFLLLDLLLILAVVKSNFRYLYSLIVPVLYAVVTLIITGVSLLILDGAGSIFTDQAKLIFIIVRAAISLVVLLTAILGSKVKKSVSILSFILLSCLTACTIFYGIFVIGNGFFGQGNLSLRPVVYEYSAADGGYVAKFALNGNASKVLINKEFNGKPVVKVDNALFIDNGVNTVEIEKGSFVKLGNFIDSSLEKEILVDISQFNEYKDAAAKKAKDSSYTDGYVNFYNAIQPSGVTGEYVTFSYDKESFDLIDGNPVHAWFGDKGEVFSLLEFSDEFEYIKYSNTSSENALYQSYQNNGYVLNMPTIEGSKINDSLKRIELKFEKVYQLRVGESNDGKYLIPDSYKNPFGTGYRYVIGSTAQNLITTNTLPERSGFDLSWKYSYNDNLYKGNLTDLSSVINLSNLVIYPEWKMQAPTVGDLKTNITDIVYGDDVVFSTESAASHNAKDVQFEYSWKKDGVKLSNKTESELSINRITPFDRGDYTLVVTAYSNHTSLTATTEVDKSINVNKKTLSVTWNEPTDDVYSGTEKTWDAQVTGVVGGDVVAFSAADYSVTGASSTMLNAGEYKLNLKVPNEWKNYYLLNEYSKSFTVKPKEIDVLWGNLTAEYNGVEQYPTATANGFNGALEVTVSGAKNAGESTVNASITDGNYLLSSATKTNTFTITPTPVTVQWQNLSFTYNGYEQKPKAYIDGVGNDGVINATSVVGAKNAGTHTAVATFNNGNYAISGTEKDFTILSKQAITVWEKTSVTYNGQEQKPVAYINGVGGDGKIYADAVTGGKNAGDYTSTATFSNGNYQVSNTTSGFSISKAKAIVSWGVNSFIYNGNYQRPTATVKGVSIDGSLNFDYLTEEQVNAGNNYQVSIALNGEDNYYIATADASRTFVINKKVVSVTWDNLVFDYDGEEHKPTASANGVDNQPLTISVSGAKVDAGKFIATASIDNANYTLSGASKQFTINKKQITVVWSNLEFNYDGEVHKPTASANDILGQPLDLIYSGEQSEVGIHTVTITCANTNYIVTNDTAQFEIKSANPIAPDQE